MAVVDNSEDIVDTRDVYERIEDCELELEDEDLSDLLREDYEDELCTLREVVAQLPSNAVYGEPLIRDSYFVEYAEQLAEDLGYVGGSEGWPFNHIDWDAAADDLKIDYWSVDWDGIEFWVRA